MDVGKIIVNSFKYPFRNISRMLILCIFFILICIVPIGMIFDNKYVTFFGLFGCLIFLLIVPGYLLSIVKIGSRESAMFPSFDLRNNIFDTIRVLCLRLVYMVVPVISFFILLSTLGQASVELLYNLQVHNSILSILSMLIILVIIWLVFEFLYFFAKARLAYLNSLTEALKVHKVIKDIRNIGIINIITWMVFMVVLMAVISVVSSFVLTIPYVGFLIDVCIVLPLIESIGNYSLGLLYSNIAENENNIDFKKFEREIELLKYEN